MVAHPVLTSAPCLMGTALGRPDTSTPCHLMPNRGVLDMTAPVACPVLQHRRQHHGPCQAGGPAWPEPGRPCSAPAPGGAQHQQPTARPPRGAPTPPSRTSPPAMPLPGLPHALRQYGGAHEVLLDQSSGLWMQGRAGHKPAKSSPAPPATRRPGEHALSMMLPLLHRHDGAWPQLRKRASGQPRGQHALWTVPHASGGRTSRKMSTLWPRARAAPCNGSTAAGASS